MTLAELSLKRPVTAIMFYVSVVVIGVIAARQLALEQFPEVNVPFVMVELPYPGSTPQEIERTVTRPVEETLSTLPGITRIQSQSRPDGATVFMEFFSNWDRDIEVTASEARERIDAIRDELPTDLQRYFVRKFSPGDAPLLRVRFASERDLTGEYDLIQRGMQRRLERLPGVARVEISGAPPPEVEIALLPSRISAHGVALNELVPLLQAMNFSVSAGLIDDGARRLRVQPVGELRSLDELRNLVIDARGLRLSDVAEVRLRRQETDFGRRLDGQSAVGLDIFRERNNNLVDVSRQVLAELHSILQQPDFQGIQLKVINDQSEGVTSSINELINAGLVGALLSVFVLYYFLRHWPSTLMVALAIPLCIVMTLGAMYFLGLTLNVLTMMGLLLGIGMLVDNAVVVVESIYQNQARYPDDPVRCAVNGTRDVQIAISAGTLTSIIVFAPNLLGERTFVSLYLGQVAVTITIALVASWLVAVSLIPMISARLKTPMAVMDPRGFIPRLTHRYRALLQWSLSHRAWSLVAILAIVAVSVVPARLTKFDMFRDDAGRELEMYLSWKGSYGLPAISEDVKLVEDFLDANRERYQITQIYSWFSERGWAGIRLNLREPNPSVWDYLLLRNHEAGLLSSTTLREQLREELPKSARAEIGFQGDGPNPGGADDGISIAVSGDASETLAEIAQTLVGILKTVPELRDVRVDAGDESTEVSVTVNRERAAVYGFTSSDVAGYIGVALRGAPLREFRHGESEIPVWLRFAGSRGFKVEDFAALNLRRADGGEVPLMSIVDVNVRKGSAQVNRENRRMTLMIQANLADGKNTEDARKAIKSALGGTVLPDGYRWNLGGNFERNTEAGARMGFNMLIALLMVYLVMAALFESLTLPAAIISSIYFSALGMFWVFWITGTTFTIMAAIGILVLMGVVVNNGIVMFEHIDAMRRRGVPRTQALVDGACERLRPILMTMGTTVLGMLPLCVGGPQVGGAGLGYYPMARAIAGGLIFSTIVSLLFLPTIYALLDDMRLASVRAIGKSFRPNSARA
ncbi:efflux RND transporter permease subunit [Tahibacter sp.]|uniref:efflux RND transporter permease subunit n=1 Tax=Tahibacter sp. TaxID=2056211 RepID=UPI0028C397CF|nr:efflux RND transporter permease subunit [Tahibacter sp.]